MSISVQHRRGTTSEHETFTGKIGEITVDTTKDTAVIHDGSTAGGHPLATEAYTDTKIEEAFDALTAADVPTSDSSNVQDKLTSYASTLNSHTTTLSDHGSQLAANAINLMAATELSGSYEGANLETVFVSEIAGYADVWAWIKARVQAENFAGLHVHDYIQVTCSNPGAYVLKMEIVGINTYKGAGGTEIPAHIDWISRDCWPDTVQYNLANYNNGIGLDKFAGDGATKVFQLTRREVGYPALSSVTVGGTAMTSGTDYTYDSTTGVLAFTSAPANAAVIKAVWATPITVPFLASNIYAYMNSLCMGVPNEAAADPLLTEVDYSAGGIYKFLPAALKAVISNKRTYMAKRYTAGSLLTSSNDYADVAIGPLWLPDEMEIYGTYMFATGTYDKWFSRWYPAFFGGNRRKGAGNGGSRAYWWLIPAYSGYSTNVCNVYNAGGATNSNASIAYLRVPVGFRIHKS